MSDEFAAIERPEKKVPIGGADVTLRPLTIGQLPAFARAVKPIVPAIGSLFGGEKIDPAAISDLIADHGDAFIDAISVATRLPRRTIEDLDPVDFLRLVGEVLAINRDFFVRRLAPALIKAREATTAATDGVGLT